MIFQDAFDKADWAKTHINAVAARIELLHETNTAIVEINPNTGGEILKHGFSDERAFRDLALIAGDVLHNLKCALDYSWYQIVKRVVPASLSDYTKFPVRKSLNELKDALHGIKIDVAHPIICDCLLDKIKPYRGGNFTVWALHHYDIMDKHRLPLPVLSSAQITGIEVQDELGETWPGSANTEKLQQPPYFVLYKAGIHVKKKGKLRADITIMDEEFDHPIHLPKSLVVFHAGVIEIVKTLERLLE